MDNNSVSSSPTSPSKKYSEIPDYQLELPAWSLDSLKNIAIQQCLPRPRSLAWAILLKALPPPSQDMLDRLKSHRKGYMELSDKLSMDPRSVVDDDPLSQNEESAWKQHFCDNELKTLILQDVVRTYPDELYFRDKDVQELMVRVLFFWARSNAVGYRQGMHEILAPLLFELYLDRRYAPSNPRDDLKYILEEDYLEHDSYILFNALMIGLERFYTTGDIVPTSEGRLPTCTVAHNPNEVIRYLEKVREEFLVPLDLELATHLFELNISMELFGIRWLRLLFGREFPRSEIPHLWGFLFADGPMLPNLHFVIVAMLISMRNNLVSREAGATLCTLMRPARLSARAVCALALHLRSPLRHPRPTPDQLTPTSNSTSTSSDSSKSQWSIEQSASAAAASDSGSEGVAEGADVARELAALALLRAQLPPAAAALASALPKPAPDVQQPLQQILQLAALLQCRNHALVDVETALEAAEGQTTEKVGRRQLVPVAMLSRRGTTKQVTKPVSRVKEVPLKVFAQVECAASDLPCCDPLRLRTE